MFVVRDGKLLLTQRETNEQIRARGGTYTIEFEGCWTIPGETVEPGETFELAFRRGMIEEFHESFARQAILHGTLETPLGNMFFFATVPRFAVPILGEESDHRFCFPREIEKTYDRESREGLFDKPGHYGAILTRMVRRRFPEFRRFMTHGTVPLPEAQPELAEAVQASR
jgi:hypothetical protein